MISAEVEAQPWSLRRWVLLVALVFVGQLGLILWLSDPKPIRPRTPRPAPVLGLAGNSPVELLALQDPTLFALPHREGFSGLAWLNGWRLEPPSYDWLDTMNWLGLDARGLGAVHTRFVITNELSSVQTPAMPPPEPLLPAVTPSGGKPAQSSLRAETVSGRGLVSAEPLRSWGHTEMLTNSIVQVVIARDGRPFSSVLLSGSGLKEVDDFALQHAKRAQFESLIRETDVEPVGSPLKDLDWGILIYEWHTLPVSSTNAPASKP